MPSGGKKNTYCCTTESPWRSTSTSVQKLKNQNSKHWILMLNTEVPQPPLNNDPTLLKRKENAKDCVTSTQEEYRTNPRNQQIRLRKGQQVEGKKNMTTQLTRKQVCDSTTGRGEACRQLGQGLGPTCRQLRHRRQSGTNPIGRRAIGILSILQALTIGDFFSQS